METDRKCLFCGEKLTYTFVDLGMSPLCESFLTSQQLNQMEPFFPLHVWVCGNCYLVQLEEFVNPKHIFSEYAYFSSYSRTWLEHAERYVKMATSRFGLDTNSLVVEVASNDGYLLQYFVAQGIPVLGIEPARNVAQVAIEKGVPTKVEFFGEQLANHLVAEGKKADLVLGNNVLAQVPNINDFVKGFKILLKPEGVFTLEFPHLIRLMEQNQFDTIYHEHFSYFSFITVEKIFAAHGLTLFDVEELPTHGGSLRIFGCHSENTSLEIDPKVHELREREVSIGITRLNSYSDFSEKVKETKWKLLDFLISTRRQGKTVVGYGAPGKGNTLLNYCGIRTDLIDYTVDRNPYKHGKYLPGTHIPIFPPEKIMETRPDYLLILPWNFKEEIMEQNYFIKEWGGQFVVPIPEVKVY